MNPNLIADQQTRQLEKRLQPSLPQRLTRTLARLGWRLAPRAGQLAKRGLDIVVALAVLLAALPLLALVGLLIKATDGGPLLFWQTRIGKWGQPFQFPKLRSMVVNAEALKATLANSNEHGDSITFKLKRDPRVTWIGRIIRKTSIDELPQLWCVLKGEMSLVGPRPALAEEVAYYSLDDRRRLDVLPGLTCIWQVSGRAEIAFAEQVRLDVRYIEEQSLREDLKLLCKTIPAVISGRGAY
ncbi:MAG: sugar transferase [Rhodocyclales bacterium]|nr:sugar transferase [Rhodocyclales bacterium]